MNPPRSSLAGARLSPGSPGLRRALAESVVRKDNSWFAAAYVNRVWGELMGQSFYMPVDDLGPEDFAGAGLGLAITRWIVEQHGGTIALISQPGAGVSVKIRLPAGPGTE